MMSQVIPIKVDQVFKHVFGRDKELCRRLIELALDEQIADVEFVEAQKESKDIEKPGGTYFDVLATTSDGEMIDVEMQADSIPGVLQRARLYSGRLTQEVWSRYVESENSYDYSKMPRIAVIFVCDFDPLGAGLRRYTGKMRYSGAADVDDGATIVFLNSRGSGDDIPADLAAFLTYAASGQFVPGTSAFVDGVARRVATVSAEAGFREGFMDLREKLWWEKQKGIEEGETRGRAEGAEERRRQIAELAAHMSADGRQDELAEVLADDERLNAELHRYGISNA